MPYRPKYSGGLDKMQDVSNKLGTIESRIHFLKSEEAKALCDVIEQIKRLNDTDLPPLIVPLAKLESTE